MFPTAMNCRMQSSCYKFQQKWIHTLLKLVHNIKKTMWCFAWWKWNSQMCFYFNKTIYIFKIFVHLLQNGTKILKSVFGQRIFNCLVCNYHVFTKYLISDLQKKKKTDTLNIRHGLKINILVNKYSENIFPFMKCAAIQIQKYTQIKL